MEEDYKSILNNYADSYQLTEKLKSLLTDTISKTTREKIILEIQCFEFYFRNGDLYPNIEGPSSSYPDLSRFSENDWNYIRERMNSVENNYLKSRYAHLLSKKTHHNNDGKIALVNYLHLCNQYIEVGKEDERSLLHFCYTLECYHALSIVCKHELHQCKDHILRYLKDDRLSPIWKGHVIEMILLSPLFKRKDLAGLTDYMLSASPISPKFSSSHENYLRTCLKLAEKENVNPIPIYLLLAEHELDLATLRSKDEVGMVAMQSYQKAAFYFRMGKNEKREKETLSKLTAQKSSINLKTFTYEFKPEHVQAVNRQLNDLVDFLLKQDYPFALTYLVENKHLLKTEQEVEKEARENLKNSFLTYANVQIYDINGNIKILTEQEKLIQQKNQCYSFHLQLFVSPFLQKLFYAGVRTGKMSTAKIFEFFNSTWFSQALASPKAKSENETFLWMNILGPGLYDLISKIEASSLNNNFEPNFQLAIDSLSIKLEGLIRDLARLSGLPVTRSKESETVELNLEELLREDKITQRFDQRDVYLWKFLFTKQGWNLRNEVAHAFLRPADYTYTRALLILLAIFRMCKYGNLVTQEEN